MNTMFKRIAALLDGPLAARNLPWNVREASEVVTSSAVERDDFRDTDIAVAWLCEASNKTRTKSPLEAH